MTESKGHFENGRWMEEKTPEKKADAGSELDARIAGVSRSFTAAIDDAVKIGKDLFETEEGRRFMEKSVRDAGTGVQSAIQDILVKAREEIDRAAKKK